MPARLPRMLRGAALAVAAAALAAPAGAAAQWSAPQLVSGRQASQIVALGFDRTGNGLLVWSAQPGPFYDTAHKPAGVASWLAGPRLPRRLAYLQATPAIALYGNSRALLVASRRGGSDSTLRYGIVGAFGTSDGSFGPPRPLDAGAIVGRDAPRSLGSPALAVNPAGDALAAWSRTDGRTSVIRLTERRAGGALGAVRTTSPVGARTPAVAINTARHRVVAWYRNGWIEARTRRAGAGWGPVLKAARATRAPAVLRAAVDGDGRFLLAWATLDYTDGEPSKLGFDAAVRAPGRGWLHHMLDRYSVRGASFAQAERHVEPGFDSGGRGFVAWHGRDAASGAPAAAIAWLAGGGAVARTQMLASGGRPSDVAAGPRERLAIVWDAETRDVALRSRIGTAVRTSGFGFAAAETLPVACPAPSLCIPLDPRVAFDPVSGGLTAAWLQRDEASWEIWVSTRVAP